MFADWFCSSAFCLGPLVTGCVMVGSVEPAAFNRAAPVPPGCPGPPGPALDGPTGAGGAAGLWDGTAGTVRAARATRAAGLAGSGAVHRYPKHRPVTAGAARAAHRGVGDVGFGPDLCWPGHRWGGGVVGHRQCLWRTAAGAARRAASGLWRGRRVGRRGDRLGRPGRRRCRVGVGGRLGRLGARIRQAYERPSDPSSQATHRCRRPPRRRIVIGNPTATRVPGTACRPSPGRTAHVGRPARRRRPGPAARPPRHVAGVQPRRGTPATPRGGEPGSGPVGSW